MCEARMCEGVDVGRVRDPIPLLTSPLKGEESLAPHAFTIHAFISFNSFTPFTHSLASTHSDYEPSRSH